MDKGNLFPKDFYLSTSIPGGDVITSWAPVEPSDILTDLEIKLIRYLVSSQGNMVVLLRPLWRYQCVSREHGSGRPVYVPNGMGPSEQGAQSP